MRSVSLRNILIALRSLGNFKLRTALAILGVFLGAFSLVVVANIAESLQKKAAIEISRLGTNVLIVRSGIVRRVGHGTALLTESANLTVRDANAIREGATGVAEVTPTGNKTFPVRYGGVNLAGVLVIGATETFPAVRNFQAAEGSFITERDDRELRKVAVLGAKVAARLFGGENPLGKVILVYRVPCTVIGVMEEKGVDISGADQDSQIFVPLQTFLRAFVNRDYVNAIYVRTLSGDIMAQAKAEVEAILRRTHKTAPGSQDDFTVIDLKDVMALQAQAMETVTTLGRIAALVSFAIGALGILSIMILIVNERRVEIGIRRAVGARRRDIILQFLLESSVISLSGGAVGVVAGVVASFAIARVLGFPFAVSPGAFVTAYLMSVVVGVLAGIHPSKKAVAIQPVDVIRTS